MDYLRVYLSSIFSRHFHLDSFISNKESFLYSILILEGRQPDGHWEWPGKSIT